MSKYPTARSQRREDAVTDSGCTFKTFDMCYPCDLCCILQQQVETRSDQPARLRDTLGSKWDRQQSLTQNGLVHAAGFYELLVTLKSMQLPDCHVAPTVRCLQLSTYQRPAVLLLISAHHLLGLGCFRWPQECPLRTATISEFLPSLQTHTASAQSEQQKTSTGPKKQCL